MLSAEMGEVLLDKTTALALLSRPISASPGKRYNSQTWGLIPRTHKLEPDLAGWPSWVPFLHGDSGSLFLSGTKWGREMRCGR